MPVETRWPSGWPRLTRQPFRVMKLSGRPGSVSFLGMSAFHPVRSLPLKSEWARCGTPSTTSAGGFVAHPASATKARASGDFFIVYTTPARGRRIVTEGIPMRTFLAAVLLFASAPPQQSELGKALLFHAGFDGTVEA